MVSNSPYDDFKSFTKRFNSYIRLKKKSKTKITKLSLFGDAFFKPLLNEYFSYIAYYKIDGRLKPENTQKIFKKIKRNNMYDINAVTKLNIKKLLNPKNPYDVPLRSKMGQVIKACYDDNLVIAKLKQSYKKIYVDYKVKKNIKVISFITDETSKVLESLNNTNLKLI